MSKESKTAARVKQVERHIPCVRDPAHKSFPVDFRPEYGKAIKARACETCGIVWRFIVWRHQGPHIILAENVKFLGGHA